MCYQQTTIVTKPSSPVQLLPLKFTEQLPDVRDLSTNSAVEVYYRIDRKIVGGVTHTHLDIVHRCREVGQIKQVSCT